VRAESWAARDVIADDVIAGNVTSDDPVLPVRRRKSRRHHADDVTVTKTTASERQAHSDSEQQQQQQQYESVQSTSLGHLPDVTSLHDGGVTSAGVTALYAEPHDMARRGRRHSTSATSSTAPAAPAAAAAAAAAGASEAETARPTVSVTRRRRQAGGGEVETAASWSVSDGYESVDYSDDDTQQQSRSKQQVLD